MTEETKARQFDDFLQEHLAFFDDLLSSTNVPLHQRPLRAALLFVQYCVIRVKGEDDKEHALGKRWFKPIYEAVGKWYADRYGAALEKKDNRAPGLVSIFNTPFRIDVPLTLAEPAEDHMVWVTFPNEVLPGEQVLKWIVAPPNLERLGNSEREELSNTITEIATATRSIRINVMTASDPGKDLQLFISSIPLHIERCVEDILKGNWASLGLAVWEMHLAVEKSLKLLIRQHGGNPENIHDLVKLAELATQLSGVTIDLITLNKLPSGREAVQARYGEGRVRSLQELVGNYRIALLLISRVAKSLKREIAMNNASFLVRDPVEPD